jgi:hypothetical protein
MPRIGLTELILLPGILLTFVAPLAVAVWVIVVLQRIKAGQEAIQAKITAIERMLGSRS